MTSVAGHMNSIGAPRDVAETGRPDGGWTVPTAADASVAIAVRVNGMEFQASVPPRLLLSDFLRHNLGLTGTHVGCEHGVCGACTVIVDGAAVRSCLLFAVQVDGSDVRTVEGLAAPDGSLDVLQSAFREEHGLQCGFCTPGILMSLTALRERVEAGEPASEAEIVSTIGGHLCRCTGYRNIDAAARKAIVAQAMEAQE